MSKLVKLSAVAIALTAVSATGFAAPTTKQLSAQIARLQAETASLQKEIQGLQAGRHIRSTRHHMRARKRFTGSRTIPANHKLRFHGISVVTSPYIGLRSSPDASDQLINAPSLNEDLYLLIQRDKLAIGHPYAYPHSPILEFSGDILGGASFGNNSNVTVNGVDLYLQAIASKWALGLLTLSYSDGSGDYISGQNASNNNLVNNSNIYLSRAFVTLGNLNKAPIYGTFGQMYVPFGTYSNYMVTTPLTKHFGRTDAPAALVGFFKDGLNADLYAFQGFNKMDNSGSANNRWGVSASKVFDTKYGQQKFGAGYISTITDSIGLNDDQVFITNANSSNQLTKSVPAVDLDTKLTFDRLTFLGEYIWTTTNFVNSDLAAGARSSGNQKPRVLDLEADYGFNNFKWSTNFAVDYGHTANAVFLGMPKDSYAGILNTSPFKNTVLSAEVRHDGAYSSAVRATMLNADNKAVKTSTTVSLQAALYF